MVEGISVVITSSEAEGEGEGDVDFTRESGSFSTADIFALAGGEQIIEKKSARD